MKLSRADFVPLLTIVAGGVIGASLSFGFLGSGSDAVPVPEPIVASENVEVLRLEEQKAVARALWDIWEVHRQ